MVCTNEIAVQSYRCVHAEQCVVVVTQIANQRRRARLYFRRGPHTTSCRTLARRSLRAFIAHTETTFLPLMQQIRQRRRTAGTGSRYPAPTNVTKQYATRKYDEQNRVNNDSIAYQTAAEVAAATTSITLSRSACICKQNAIVLRLIHPSVCP